MLFRNGSQGFALNNDTQVQHDAGRHGYVTVLNTWFDDIRDRQPKSSGGQYIHICSVLGNGWSSAPMDIVNNGAGDNNNVGFSGLSWAYAEEGFYENPAAGASNLFAARATNGIAKNGNPAGGPSTLYHNGTIGIGAGMSTVFGTGHTAEGTYTQTLPPEWSGGIPYGYEDKKVLSADLKTTLPGLVGAANMDTGNTAMKFSECTFTTV